MKTRPASNPMPRALRWIAAAYAAIMGGVVAWAGLDYYTHVHRRRPERQYP